MENLLNGNIVITLNMDKKITIRKGKFEDIGNIKKCLINSWVNHAKRVPSLMSVTRMRKSDIEGYYKKAFSNPDSYVLVAEVDGSFAGFIRADIKEIEPFFKNNKIFYLDDTFVLPKYRQMGIAKKLLGEVEKMAKRRKIKRLQAKVYTFNKITQNFLTKSGFIMPYSTWDKTIR